MRSPPRRRPGPSLSKAPARRPVTGIPRPGLTRWGEMADAAVPAPPRVPAADAGTDPDTLNLPIGVGRRVVVVANLGLTPVPSPASSWAANGLARALDTWEGPGLVVVAGNTFDLRGRHGPRRDGPGGARRPAPPGRRARGVRHRRGAARRAAARHQRRGPAPRPRHPSGRDGDRAPGGRRRRPGAQDGGGDPPGARRRQRAGGPGAAPRRGGRERVRARRAPGGAGGGGGGGGVLGLPRPHRRLAGRPRPAGGPRRYAALLDLAPAVSPLRPSGVVVDRPLRHRRRPAVPLRRERLRAPVLRPSRPQAGHRPGPRCGMGRPAPVRLDRVGRGATDPGGGARLVRPQGVAHARRRARSTGSSTTACRPPAPPPTTRRATPPGRSARAGTPAS